LKFDSNLNFDLSSNLSFDSNSNLKFDLNLKFGLNSNSNNVFRKFLNIIRPLFFSNIFQPLFNRSNLRILKKKLANKTHNNPIITVQISHFIIQSNDYYSNKHTNERIYFSHFAICHFTSFSTTCTVYDAIAFVAREQCNKKYTNPPW
jgi:hypothetical protein